MHSSTPRNPTTRGSPKLFDLMEHSCRSGFNNAFDLHYTQHTTTEPKATQEIPA